ncbi:MAG: hypothetical protein LAT68_06605 [Cyclobacteriaceae bacterium]|nr:hypothetical protein [Cyclobacteriaceae bacterium]MCH8515982.1 hypothetical protein [Cyclobacteriaceae bacterium]
MILFEFFKGIFPYLLCVPLGYFVSKKGWLPKKWVTIPMIFVLMPVLIVNHVLKADAESLKLLPAIGFILALSMLIPAEIFNRYFGKGTEKGLIQSSFSFYNVAFFGIPTVIALFGKDSVTLLICIYIGTALYGDIIGYYQVAKSKYGLRESLMRVFKIPFIYAFILAASLRIGGIESPDLLADVSGVFGILVSVGGMLIIGMNVSSVDFTKLRYRFLSGMMSIRLVSGVIFTAILLVGEYYLFDLLSTEARQMMAIVPLFPIAANVTLFASFLKADEAATATWILVSMLISLILIPLAGLFF